MQFHPYLSLPLIDMGEIAILLEKWSNQAILETLKSPTFIQFQRKIFVTQKLCYFHIVICQYCVIFLRKLFARL